MLHFNHWKKRRELDVSHWKWINLNLLLLLHFVLNLFVRFIIIIQSEVVINLYLNFSALMFTNELSEIAFLLAESGFLLKKAEVSAKKIKHIKVCREEWRNPIILPIWCCWCHSVHSCSFILPICLVVLFSGWLQLFIQQKSGAPISQSIQVQASHNFKRFVVSHIHH